MNLSSQQIEDLRLAILRVLDAGAGQKFGLPLPALGHHLVQYGFRNLPGEILRRQLNYLAGEPLGYVTQADKGGFSPENAAWKITTKGMNFVAQQSGE